MALAFVRAGVSGLVLVARSISALNAVEQEAHTIRGGRELNVIKLAVDVASDQAVSDAVQAVKTTFGRLDVLVNNAAILEKLALIGQSDPSVWWSTWEINVKGTYLVTRAFLDLLLESGRAGGLEGRKIVVNLSSIGALLTSEGISAYQVCITRRNNCVTLMIFPSLDGETRRFAFHRVPRS